MTHEVGRPQRRSIRLRDYDYAQAGAYFVTVVTRDRKCLFGDVVEGYMRLNQAGRVVQTMWGKLPDHYTGVECDSFVVMPNHVHGIIMLANDVVAGLKPAPTLPEIIRGFKTFSARRINEPACRSGNAIITTMWFAGKRIEPYPRIHREQSIAMEMDRENPNRTGSISVAQVDSWKI